MNKFKKKLSVFVAKLLKYRLLFKDILTFLGLDYGDALHIILYLVVIEIKISKIRWIGQIYHTKNVKKKAKIQHVLNWLSGNDYRLALLSKSFITVTVTVWNRQDISNRPKLAMRTNCYGGRTDSNIQKIRFLNNIYHCEVESL